MRGILRLWLAALPLAIPACPVMAQPPAAPTAPAVAPQTTQPTTVAAPQAPVKLPAPEPGNAVAASVNGQPIPESMVQKMLRRVPAEKHKEARPELVNYLVENVLIDQYLLQLQIKVDAKEVDQKLNEMKAEIKKQNLEYEKVLKDMMVTEAELRDHLTSDLRWNKYATAQANEKVVRDLFESNKELFNGTMMRVRHILITPVSTDPKAQEAALAQVTAIKKDIEQKVAGELAKLPPGTDNLAREKARTKALDEAFQAAARDKSSCPSKSQGGDVGWFHRAGVMVEPFAKAAFALQPYQMSEIVKTPFGYHLIMALDRRAGREVKFDDVKDEAKEVYCDRLREALVVQLKPKAKIVINAPTK